MRHSGRGVRVSKFSYNLFVMGGDVEPMIELLHEALVHVEGR